MSPEQREHERQDKLHRQLFQQNYRKLRRESRYVQHAQRPLPPGSCASLKRLVEVMKSQLLKCHTPDPTCGSQEEVLVNRAPVREPRPPEYFAQIDQEHDALQAMSLTELRDYRQKHPTPPDEPREPSNKPRLPGDTPRIIPREEQSYRDAMFRWNLSIPTDVPTERGMAAVLQADRTATASLRG